MGPWLSSSCSLGVNAHGSRLYTLTPLHEMRQGIKDGRLYVSVPYYLSTMSPSIASTLAKYILTLLFPCFTCFQLLSLTRKMKHEQTENRESSWSVRSCFLPCHRTAMEISRQRNQPDKRFLHLHIPPGFTIRRDRPVISISFSFRSRDTCVTTRQVKRIGLY